MKRVLEENDKFRVESETLYYLIDKTQEDKKVITSHSLKDVKLTWNRLVDESEDEMEAEE